MILVSRDFPKLITFLLSHVKNRITYNEIYEYFNSIALKSGELLDYYSGEVYPENGYSVCPKLSYDIKFLISLDILKTDKDNMNRFYIEKDELKRLHKFLLEKNSDI